MNPQNSQGVRQPYDTDLSNVEWRIIEHFIPSLKSNSLIGGRPAKYTRREIMNAILYVCRTGCAWRLLPHDFPQWKTVYEYFRAWHAQDVFVQMNDALRKIVRRRTGKNSEPSAGIIDSQSVRIVANIGFSGYDGAKRLNGRKRHLVVDTLGLLLTVVVHDASVSDRDGVPRVLTRLADHCRRIRVIFADQGYTGKLIIMVKTLFRINLSIVSKVASHTFKVLPKRWVVERTFAWLTRYRRLSKDYERYPATSEAFIYLAMSNLMMTRLARGF